MLDRRELRRHIKTLSRRLDYLGKRIATRQGAASARRIDNDEAYDRAEAKALATAIDLMEGALRTLPAGHDETQTKTRR